MLGGSVHNVTGINVKKYIMFLPSKKKNCPSTKAGKLDYEILDEKQRIFFKKKIFV